MILNNIMPQTISFTPKAKIRNIEKYPTNFNFEWISKRINTSEDESCYCHDWVRIHGKYYYFKYSPIRELLMEQLYNQYGLECVSFELVTRFGANGVMSKNFRTFDNEYDRINQFILKRTSCDTPISNTGLDVLSDLIGDSTSKKSKKTIMDDLTKMLALDYFTGQADRFARNIILETSKKTNETRLAPLTDNGICFRDYNINRFVGYIQDLDFDPKCSTHDADETMSLLKDNELFRRTFESLLQLDFSKIIKKVEEKHNIEIGEYAIEAILKLLDAKKDIIDTSLKLTK